MTFGYVPRTQPATSERFNLELFDHAALVRILCDALETDDTASFRHLSSAELIDGILAVRHD